MKSKKSQEEKKEETQLQTTHRDNSSIQTLSLIQSLTISDFGLSVSFGNYRVNVISPAQYSNHVCGLCGDWDGNRNNDYTTDLASYQVEEDVGVE